jgi:hypothetical protein
MEDATERKTREKAGWCVPVDNTKKKQNKLTTKQVTTHIDTSLTQQHKTSRTTHSPMHS